MRQWRILAAVVIAAALAAPALAQNGGELVLYSRGHFTGARFAVSGSTGSLKIPFVVKSIAVPAGTDWELCNGNTFSGCRRFSRSVPTIALTVRSARPVAVGGVTIPVVSVSSQPNPSLRGMASEYFVAPQVGGKRIQVQPATAESTSREANDFCRSIGWQSSAHATLQTAGGASYLADVLCI